MERKIQRRSFLIGTMLSGAALSSMAWPAAPTAAADKPITVVLVPKLIGVPWYNAVKQGIDAALQELPNVRVVWQGAPTDEVDKQIQLIDSLIATHPDVIGVAADDPAAMVPVLKKVEAAHIKVMSWDGDANYRGFFVAMVDNDVMGREFCDEMARQIGPEGDVAIITSNFAAANQVAWIKAIKERIQEKYPKLNILATLPSEEDQQLAFKAAQDIIKSYPNVKGIFAVTTVALPGAAEAIKAAGLAGKIAVVGNSQPSAVRSLIKDGTIKTSVMFNPIDMGYLSLYGAVAYARDQVQIGTPFKAGRLGDYTPVKDDVSMRVTLGPPKRWTIENIDTPEAQF
jgi:ABC-type sugar transport system substrate-binding protein